MRLTLPLPPSANAYWRMVNGRMLLSKQARAYRERCAFAATFQWKRPPIEGRVRIRADVYMDLRGDLTNREKQLWDALEGIVFKNDSQIWALHMVRHLERENPRVEIDVHELSAEDAA